MKNRNKILLFFISGMFLYQVFNSQTSSPAPYCNGNYTSGKCNQPNPSNSPGNFVNDFIDCFQTSGATSDINNCNSGCNGNPNNYVFYCQHYMVVNPGQTITCTMRSGITYPGICHFC